MRTIVIFGGVFFFLVVLALGLRLALHLVEPTELSAPVPVVADARVDTGQRAPVDDEPAVIEAAPPEDAVDDVVDVEEEGADGGEDEEDEDDEALDEEDEPDEAAARVPKDCSVKKVKRRDDGAYVLPTSALEQYVLHPDRLDKLGSFGWKKTKKGQIKGVRMSRMPCPGMLRAGGLRNGDVVLSVNGTPATSVARGFSIWRDAKSSGKARVVVRHGKEGTRTIRYILKD